MPFWKTCPFLTGDRGGVGLGERRGEGEVVGREEGGEAAVKMEYTREESIKTEKNKVPRGFQKQTWTKGKLCIITLDVKDKLQNNI